MNKIYDFIIIGGGISGLYCAMELSNTWNVLLLESSDRIGGRIHTHKNPQYEIGAGRLHSSHVRLLSLLKRFHLNIIPLSKRIDHINTMDGYVPNVNLYIDEMLQRTTRTLSEEKREQSFYEHSLSILGKEDTERLHETRGYTGDFHMNAYDTIQMFRREMKGNYFIVKEGLNELIRRMLQENKSTTKLNHKVKNISYNMGEYQVDEYRTKKIIVALPKRAIQSISFLQSSLFQSVDTVPLIRIYAKYPLPAWFDGLPHITTTHKLGHVIPIRDGIIMISYTEEIEFFMQDGKTLSNKKIERKIKEELNKMFPSLSIPDPEWVKVYVWDIGYHAWKKMVHSGNIQKKINSLFPGIFFCGEAYSHTQGWVEGSLETASNVLKLNLG